jgi:hypothetical protein
MDTPITEHDSLIETMEAVGTDDPADIVSEIKLDLFTDLMAAGETYRPLSHTNRPSPPGSRYGGDD